MPQLTNYQLSLEGARWIDVNTQYGLNNLPDRLSDDQAIVYSSLYNLFNCVPGQRARTFQPTYGSIWLQFIHEPISSLTAQKMEIFMIKAIQKWEPRIKVDLTRSSVIEDTNIPGYRVRISYTMPGSSSSQQVNFDVPII